MQNIELNKYSGSHYEIGLQQGKYIKNMMKKALKNISKFEFVKYLKPNFLPYSLFLFYAKNKAYNQIWKDIEKFYPKQSKRLIGISKGSNIDLKTILLIQASEMLLTIKESDYFLEACTSIVFSSNIVKSKEIIIAKNFDYPNEFAPFLDTCCTNPSQGFKTLGCKMAPLPGLLDGINEHGLSITYNLAYTKEVPDFFIPISIFLQEMLETCKNTNQALKFISESKRAGSALLTICDKQNNIKSVEISQNNYAIIEPKNNYMINTNHFQSPSIKKYQVEDNAVYTKKAPKPLQGLRVHESSYERYKRAKKLIDNTGEIDFNFIKNLLSDHGLNNDPSTMTICRHDKHASTLRSIIIYPNSKKIKVLYGNPCQKDFCSFSFN